MMTAKRKKTTLKADIFDQLIADDIKKDIDIIRLFDDFGVKLTKKGNSYTGLCPFHDDKTPSLSVDRNKGLFNCFGCGESGDVISLVQKVKGLSFKESMEFLKKWKTGSPADLSFPIDDLEIPEDEDLTEEQQKTKGSFSFPNSQVQSPEANQGAEETGPTSLGPTGVINYYHKKLYDNKQALDYLKSRGLNTKELYSRFKIGFSDGSLLGLAGPDQREQLKELGIFNDHNFETFKNCLIFPIFDDTGNVVGVYGRNISNSAKVKHLYLKGRHKGIFNRKASKVYDEIILTESIIDCLSLIETGLNNVQACYGINGFTDEHLQTLKDDRVKTVIIAFDNDDAGVKASDDLKEKLTGENFKVKIIIPPVKKDWNEELINGIDKDTIKGLIDSTVIFEKKENKKAFDVIKDAFGYIFTTGEIHYQVNNVKDSFTHNLKVNIRTEYRGERFPDNVDLYSSRSRDALSLKLSQRFGVEVKRIEKDLLLILDYLEDEQRKRLSPDDEEKQELTEKEIKIGTDFLKSPDLFDQIVADMTTLGYVGEDLNKQLLYLCATSRLMDDPISVMIVSQSASGKSYLVDTVARLIPENEVIEFHTLSQQALQYMGDKLLHKFMTMGESSHDKDIENQLRQILSGHKLSRYVVVKNEKTGEMTTEQVLVHAVVASVLTTTSSKINPENASRYFIVNTDESTDQTVRIYEAQKHKYSKERQEVKENVIPDIIKKHHISQRLLKKIAIVIPSKMRDKLKFPFKVMRLRRDHERFIDLIAVVCFLRQYQKETKNNGKFACPTSTTSDSGRDYVECDKKDYRIAYTILINDVLRSTISEIPQQSMTIYEAVREIAKANAEVEGIKAHEVTVSQREIREHTGFNQMFVKRYIKILVDYEYLKIKLGGRGSRAEYSLIADEELNHIDISMIPTPDEMDKILR